MANFTILWHSEEARNNKDFIPVNWFENVGRFSGMVHLFRVPGYGMCKAKCDLMVGETYAELDYAARKKDQINVDSETIIGILKIHFVDSQRNEIRYVEWRDEREKSFKPCSVTVGVAHSRAESNIHQNKTPTSDDNFSSLEDIDAIEGTPVIVEHLLRERNGRIITKKKEDVLTNSGKLECEACGFNFETFYGEIGKNFCEVHHQVPIAQKGISHTKLEDLHVLCSNCHRIIHRTKPLMSVDEFKHRYLNR